MLLLKKLNENVFSAEIYKWYIYTPMLTSPESRLCELGETYNHIPYNQSILYCTYSYKNAELM